MSGIINSAGSKSGVIGETEIDYEEGEWTPASSSINLTPSNGANYTRIGNRVIVSAYLTTTQSSTGDFIVSGLPFTNTGASQAAGSIYLRTLGTDITNGSPVLVVASGTSFYVRFGGRSDSGNDVLTKMDADSNFWMSLTYEIGA